MSHVVAIKLRIKDLNALNAAGQTLGMEMIPAAQFKWFGRHVGDYPLPEGFTKEDMGKCVYALRLKGNSEAYEVGVAQSKIHPGEYELLLDFWQGGFGLEDAIGKQGCKLRQEYSSVVTQKAMRKQGLRITKSVTSDGKIVLRGRR